MTEINTPEKVRKAVDDRYDEIAAECFGLWSNSLWQRYDGISSFSELKDAFFYLISRLLDEGKIRFIKPNENVLFVADGSLPSKTICDESTHWTGPIKKIISYLRRLWPSSAQDFDDEELSVFFYEIPPIIWRDKDGNWRGS